MVFYDYGIYIAWHKAISSGNPVSGPRPHQFFAMPKFGHYWYCACVILFKVHLKAQGSGFQVGRTCVSDLCTYKLVFSLLALFNSSQSY